jgi:hypothetical protein
MKDQLRQMAVIVTILATLVVTGWQMPCLSMD